MKFILNNMIQISNKILGLNKKNFQGSLRKIFPNFNSVMLLHMPLPLSKIFQFSLPSFLPLHLFRTITYYHNIWEAFVDIPKFIIFGATFQNAPHFNIFNMKKLVFLSILSCKKKPDSWNFLYFKFSSLFSNLLTRHYHILIFCDR